MKKYTVWCKFLVHCPNPRDKYWNMVPSSTIIEPFDWGYDTYEDASQRAQEFQAHWQPGVMSIVIREIELPD